MDSANQSSDTSPSPKLFTREDLINAGHALYGERGWQEAMARDLCVDSSSVRRWTSGAIPVPGPVAAALKCWLRENTPEAP